MENPKLKGIIIFVMVLFLAAGSVYTAAPAAKSDYKEKLKSVDARIKAINDSLEKLKKEKSTLTGDIYKIDLQYTKESEETNKIRLQLKETEETINTKETQKEGLQSEIAKSKKNLKKILRILYKVGGNTYLKLFIRVDTLDQLYKNYRLFVSLVEFKAEEINRIKQNILELNKIKKQLQTEYNSLEEFKTRKEEKLANIKRLKQGKLNIIRRINNDRDDYIRMLEELKVESERLNEVISGKRTKSSLRVIDLKRIKGRLQWPLSGRVTSSFGKKKSKRYNTYVIDNGIKLTPYKAGRIKAVYYGDVVFAEYYKSYGNVIIIQHSRDLYTLYGYCEKFLKKVGDSVLTGEDIAIVGDTGSTVKKTLYFEIRHNAKAEDPLTWLRKRR